MARFGDGHGHGDLWGEPDLRADRDALPRGHDPVGAVDVAADEVLQRVVAVEAAAPLPELRDPRPDVGGAGVDRDGPGRGQVRVRDELVAGQGRRELLAGGAPVGHPPQPQHGDRQHRDGDQRGERDGDTAYREGHEHNGAPAAGAAAGPSVPFRSGHPHVVRCTSSGLVRRLGLAGGHGMVGSERQGAAGEGPAQEQAQDGEQPGSRRSTREATV